MVSLINTWLPLFLCNAESALFCTLVVLYGAALVAQEGGLMDWYDIARYWYGCGIGIGHIGIGIVLVR